MPDMNDEYCGNYSIDKAGIGVKLFTLLAGVTRVGLGVLWRVKSATLPVRSSRRSEPIDIMEQVPAVEPRWIANQGVLRAELGIGLGDRGGVVP